MPAGKEMIEMYFDFRLFRLWKSRQHSKLLDYDGLLWRRLPCVGLFAGNLTSEPNVWWTGVWIEMLLSKLCGRADEAEQLGHFFPFWRGRVAL